jgi:hypothetical protein
MYPTYFGAEQRSLEADDVAGACFQYPRHHLRARRPLRPLRLHRRPLPRQLLRAGLRRDLPDLRPRRWRPLHLRPRVPLRHLLELRLLHPRLRRRRMPQRLSLPVSSAIAATPAATAPPTSASSTPTALRYVPDPVQPASPHAPPAPSAPSWKMQRSVSAPPPDVPLRPDVLADRAGRASCSRSSSRSAWQGVSKTEDRDEGIMDAGRRAAARSRL